MDLRWAIDGPAMGLRWACAPSLLRSATKMRERRSTRVAAAAAVLLLLTTAPASAHALHGNVDAPLPFVAYLAGAAVAVAL